MFRLYFEICIYSIQSFTGCVFREAKVKLNSIYKLVDILGNFMENHLKKIT